MAEATDYQLLRKYSQNGSEDAFRVLVDRHLNLVYSVALSRLRNEASARDITQVVFAALGRKAGQLSEKVVLSGWLFQVTTHACQDLRRAEMRRKKWESEAVQSQMIESTSNQAQMDAIAPTLAQAVASLAPRERDAIVLRFFEQRDFRQVGLQLGISEGAAKMRVARGLERLRHLLQKHGVSVSEATLCGAFPHLLYTAPAGLGPTIKAGAAIHAALSPANAALLKGVLKAMAWTKAKTAIVIGLGVLLLTGTSSIAVREIQTHRVQVWRQKYDPSIMGKIPPQVKIVPAIPSRPGENWGDNVYGKIGLGVSVLDMVESAYDVSRGRIVIAALLPAGNYDFISNLTNGSGAALQLEMKKKFGLVAAHQVIETNVLILTLRNPRAPELRATSSRQEESSTRNPYNGSYWCVNKPISNLATFLEDCLKMPVVDQTGLTNHYDIEFIGGSTPESLKQTVLNEVGLELVPARAPVELLVVQKAE